MLCLSLAAVSLKHKTIVEPVIHIAEQYLLCASLRGQNRFEQVEAACHISSSLVLAARDSRRGRQCTYPQRHTADHKTREEERGSVPSDKLEPASRRSTTRPADPSNDHHEKQVCWLTLGGDDDRCHLALHRATAPISKDISY